MSDILNLIINVITKPIESVIRWWKLRSPLRITIAPKIKYKNFGIRNRNYRGTIGKGELNINFSNITDGNINATINDIDFSPKNKKALDFLNFKFEKAIYKKGPSWRHQEITVVKGDTLFRFPFEIECIKSFNKDDFKKYKDIPMIFKIKYSVSPKFREKTLKIELRDFFEKCIWSFGS